MAIKVDIGKLYTYNKKSKYVTIILLKCHQKCHQNVTKDVT